MIFQDRNRRHPSTEALLSAEPEALPRRLRMRPSAANRSPCPIAVLDGGPGCNGMQG